MANSYKWLLYWDYIVLLCIFIADSWSCFPQGLLPCTVGKPKFIIKRMVSKYFGIFQVPWEASFLLGYGLRIPTIFIAHSARQVVKSWICSRKSSLTRSILTFYSTAIWLSIILFRCKLFEILQEQRKRCSIETCLLPFISTVLEGINSSEMCCFLFQWLESILQNHSIHKLSSKPVALKCLFPY